MRTQSGGGEEDVAGFDEAHYGLGFPGSLQAEAVDGGVGDVIKDEGGAGVGVGEFEADVVQSEAADVAGVEGVGGPDAGGVIFSDDFWDIADGGFLGGATAGEGDVDVVEADVFEEGVADGVEADAGFYFAGVVVTDELAIGQGNGNDDGVEDAVK